jgi:hypothetical protein
MRDMANPVAANAERGCTHSSEAVPDIELLA